MLDKDKLFIIYYIGFPESIDTITVSECIGYAYKSLLERFDESIKLFVLPEFGTRNHRIAYLNKDKATDDEIERLENAIREYDEMIKNEINKKQRDNSVIS